jgi:hypothetical protein
MSSSAIINEVSELLKAMLQAGLPPQNGGAAVVVAESPADLPFPNPPAGPTLSIWLYQVTPDPYLRNAPNPRIRDQETEQITPLALDLYYLLTPMRSSEKENQITLGSALQIIHDNSIIPLRAGADIEELHLSICQRSIEELAKVWEAVQKPYRLSVCIEVRVVQIDSARVLPGARIRDRATAFEDNPVEVGV